METTVEPADTLKTPTSSNSTSHLSNGGAKKSATTVDDLLNSSSFMNASDLTIGSPSSSDTMAAALLINLNESILSQNSILNHRIPTTENTGESNGKLPASSANLADNSGTELFSSGLRRGARRSHFGIMIEKTMSEEWKLMVLLGIHILSWKKPWYPLAIFIGNSFFMYELWTTKLSFLSIIFLLGFFGAVGDAILPLIIPSLKDHLFQMEDSEDQLASFQAIWEKIRYQYDCRKTQFTILREQMPRACSMIMAFVFLLLAWTFARVSMMMLIYLVSTMILLLPGIYQYRHKLPVEEFVRLAQAKWTMMMEKCHGKMVKKE